MWSWSQQKLLSSVVYLIGNWLTNSISKTTNNIKNCSAIEQRYVLNCFSSHRKEFKALERERGRETEKERERNQWRREASYWYGNTVYNTYWNMVRSISALLQHEPWNWLQPITRKFAKHVHLGFWKRAQTNPLAKHDVHINVNEFGYKLQFSDTPISIIHW